LSSGLPNSAYVPADAGTVEKVQDPIQEEHSVGEIASNSSFIRPAFVTSNKIKVIIMTFSYKLEIHGRSMIMHSQKQHPNTFVFAMIAGYNEILGNSEDFLDPTLNHMALYFPSHFTVSNPVTYQL